MAKMTKGVQQREVLTSTATLKMSLRKSWFRLRRLTRNSKIILEGEKPITTISIVDFAKADVADIKILDSSDASVQTLELDAPDDLVAQRQEALLIVGKGVYKLESSYEIPSCGEHEIIIRNKAVGLNPIDWKSVDYNFCMPEFPWVSGSLFLTPVLKYSHSQINGRESAGTVSHIGASVTGVKVGDRVWTSTYYRDRRAGCFQQYVTVPKHTACPIPSSLDYTSAACLGVAGLTAAMTLWRWLGVPMSLPSETAQDSEPEYLLIWGGSTATGQFAIQIASQSGLKVIAVTSAKTSSLARDLGAAHVVTRDGKTNDAILAEIKSIGGERITRGIDLVGGATAALGLLAMSSERPSVFAPLAMMARDQVVPVGVRVETVEMKQFVLDADSVRYAEELNRLIETGRLRLPEIHAMDGGLGMVEEGLRRVKMGDMAGKKMVVRME